MKVVLAGGDTGAAGTDAENTTAASVSVDNNDCDYKHQ